MVHAVGEFFCFFCPEPAASAPGLQTGCVCLTGWAGISPEEVLAWIIQQLVGKTILLGSAIDPTLQLLPAPQVWSRWLRRWSRALFANCCSLRFCYYGWDNIIGNKLLWIFRGRCLYQRIPIREVIRKQGSDKMRGIDGGLMKPSFDPSSSFNKRLCMCAMKSSTFPSVFLFRLLSILLCILSAALPLTLFFPH